MKKYLNIVFLSYILLFLPQLICSLTNNFSLLTILYFVSFSLNCLLFFMYFIKNKIKLEKKSILFISLYIFILIFTIVSNIIFGINTHLNDFFDFIIIIINMLIYYCAIPKEIYDKNAFASFFKKMVFLGVISCIYNFVFNYSTILHFFSITNSYSVNLSSFFVNRNTYAQFLFIMVISNFILINLENKNKTYKLTLLILITICALFIFFLVYYSKGIKSFKSRAFIIILSMIIIFFIMSNNNLISFISNNFIRAEVGDTNRSHYWRVGLDLISSHNFINGIGYYTALDMIKINQFHSFFIDTLIESGLMGLIFKILLIAVIFIRVKKYLKIVRQDDYLSVIYAAYFGLIFFCIFESMNFFLLGFTENQITIMFITLPMLYLNRLKGE